MKIRVHICVFVSPKDIYSIENYLTTNTIKYKKTPFLDNRIIVTFDVWESNDKYNDTLNFFSQYNPIITKSSQYSRCELDNAEWLSVLCYWGKVDIPTAEAYDSIFSVDCEKCKAKKQIDYYKICSPVKWQKNKNICANTQGGWDILFCSEYARQVFNNNDIKGITFNPVLNYRSLQPIPNLYQLCINVVKNPIDLSLIPQPESCVCTSCGKITYTLSDNLTTLSLDMNEFKSNTDAFIVKVNITGCYLIVVSNKLYRLLKNVLKESTLDFKPIKNKTERDKTGDGSKPLKKSD